MTRLEPQIERIRAVLDYERAPTERDAARWSLDGVAKGWLRTDLPDEAPAPWERDCLHWPIAFPEAFLGGDRTGFDAIVANPPFLGGKRVSGRFGSRYREHLTSAIAANKPGNVDLVVYFLLRMTALTSRIGSLATNSVSQGDNRDVGLLHLRNEMGWEIYRAVKSAAWPNDANLEIAKLWLSMSWTGSRVLNDVQTIEISASLDSSRRLDVEPEQLVEANGRAFVGSLVNGMGFIIDSDEAAHLIGLNPQNADVVRPYLSGSDLNGHPHQVASRWIIDFSDRSEAAARDYPACFEILRERVRPVRAALKNKPKESKFWWRFERRAIDFHSAAAEMDRVMALVLHSPSALPVFIRNGQVASHASALFAYEDDGHFGLLSSAFHWWWAVAQSGSLGGESNIRYNPSRAFRTFAQPCPQTGEGWGRVEAAGSALDAFRQDLMMRLDLGLTKVYNRYHSASDSDPEIEGLRKLHVDLDAAVRDAYGWSDLDLDHHHWETPQGVRFTVSQEAKDEILDRLLELNHERYAEEVAAGLHDKKAKKTAKRATKKASKNQGKLL
ncbi:MAG: type IIL restriction-modification enzyme MmeI [Acidimicrobiales bacterium]